MNKKDPQLINFCILDEKDVDNLAYPAFNFDIATTRDKEAQWLFYFAKHQKEVLEGLNGEEEVFCAHFSWIQDYMPAFAEAIQSDDLTAGSYIGIGNKTLHSLCVGESKLSKKSYIRFSDNKSMDEIAKEVYAEEITPKNPKKKERKKGGRDKDLTLAEVLDLPDYENIDEIENIIVVKKSLSGLEQDFFISAKLINGEIEHALTHYRAIPPQTAPSLDFHKQEYVSFAKVYGELYQTIIDYVAFPTDSIAPDLIALGSMASYFREAYYTYAYFDYISSEPEAGKTTAMKVQTFTSFYGTIASSVTEALLFREIDGSHCFYGLDNIERIFSSPKDYIGIIDWLLSSYSKEIPCKRLEKFDEDYRVRYFDGYGIKAFTHIQDFPYALRALRSRCIQIVMQNAKPKKFYPSAEKFGEIRDRLYNVRLHEYDTVKACYKNLINNNILSGRTGDLYLPLLSIAKLVDKKLYQRVLSYATTEEVERKELDSWNMMLIKVLLDNELLGSRSTNEIRGVYEEALILEGLLKDATLATRTVTIRLKKLGFQREEKKTDHKTWYLIDRKKLVSKAYEYNIINEEEEEKDTNTHTPPKGTLCTFVPSGEDKDKTQKGSVERGEADKASTEEIETGIHEEDEEGSKGRKVQKRGVCKDKIISHSPVQKATCEQCGEERFLDHEWKDGEQKRLICSKCASELKEVVSDE